MQAFAKINRDVVILVKHKDIYLWRVIYSMKGADCKNTTVIFHYTEDQHSIEIELDRINTLKSRCEDPYCDYGLPKSYIFLEEDIQLATFMKS